MVITLHAYPYGDHLFVSKGCLIWLDLIMLMRRINQMASTFDFGIYHRVTQ